MKKEEPIHRLPKSFFEQERPTISMEKALEDVVPIDWVEQVRYEESIGEEVDPEFKKFLGMEVREEEIPYEE